MAAQNGFDMVLSYNTNTHASPTWVTVGQIGDLNISDLEWSLGEINIRSSRYRRNLPGDATIGVEFSLLYNAGVTAFDALRADFFARTVRQYYISDGAVATNGTQGLRAGFIIQRFPWNQPLVDGSFVDVRLALGWYESPSGTLVDPDWYTISA